MQALTGAVHTSQYHSHLYSPGVVVPIQESGTEEEVEILPKAPNPGIHLSLIPHRWSFTVFLLPRPNNLYSILPHKGICLHTNSDLQRLCERHCAYAVDIVSKVVCVWTKHKENLVTANLVATLSHGV